MFGFRGPGFGVRDSGSGWGRGGVWGLGNGVCGWEKLRFPPKIVRSGREICGFSPKILRIRMGKVCFPSKILRIRAAPCEGPRGVPMDSDPRAWGIGGWLLIPQDECGRESVRMVGALLFRLAAAPGFVRTG